jgi:HAD superfamily hydrolase (TIGR01509 family)
LTSYLTDVLLLGNFIRRFILKTKGVFFDWGFTLAHPEPERDIQFHRCAQELGVVLPFEGLLEGVCKADNQVPEGAPPRYAKDKDKAPFLKWWQVLLGSIGGDLPENTKLAITELVGARVKEAKWVLYDDVLPTLESLKKQGFILGLISNISMDRAGLERLLDVTVTAQDVGVGKPETIIFETALKQAGLTASEAIYIGDQYEVDVLGARRAGMKAILIDRYNLAPPVKDCPHISNLSDVIKYL